MCADELCTRPRYGRLQGSGIWSCCLCATAKLGKRLICRVHSLRSSARLARLISPHRCRRRRLARPPNGYSNPHQLPLARTSDARHTCPPTVKVARPRRRARRVLERRRGGAYSPHSAVCLRVCGISHVFGCLCRRTRNARSVSRRWTSPISTSSRARAVTRCEPRPALARSSCRR